MRFLCLASVLLSSLETVHASATPKTLIGDSWYVFGCQYMCACVLS